MDLVFEIFGRFKFVFGLELFEIFKDYYRIVFVGEYYFVVNFK